MHQDVAVVGFDLAKRVFQVHAVGRDGQITIRRKLLRGEVLAFEHLAEIRTVTEGTI